MATTTLVPNTDGLSPQRPLAPPNSSLPWKRVEHTLPQRFSAQYHASPPPCRSRSAARRSPRSRLDARAHRASMQTSPRTFAPMPSFGSVFGEEAHSTHPKVQKDGEGTSAHGAVGRPLSSGNPHGVPFAAFHIHRDSRDSTSTASSDNSPTTTISTMDSSSVTDPSPGPSPESPIARPTTSSFVADFRSRRTDAGSQDSSPNTFFELARPTTPAKKPRNLKNLGINTSSSLGNLRMAPTVSLPAVEKKEKNSSAPPSPLFIKPPTPPKRRPSNLSLTISTPGSNESKPMRLMIPSTPALNRPALRHFQSSPQLPLCSPAVGPSGGMQFPVLRPVRTNPPQLAEVPYEMEEEEDQEPNFDIPQSREEKPAAYPNGPIQIYQSGVFLYFEPTAEQACTFDVIINVASEVKNPFTVSIVETQKDIDARRIDGPPAENPDFACLPARSKPFSFDAQTSSPTTPKATPVLDTKQSIDYVVDGKTYKTPEYIHMLWEHNTDIVPDLFKLVKTMDERVQQGKRVLVHCQCGVSRSASLIVAYGLYKNPGMSVQETYDIVKKRSKWIGPNMNLIMQLQEFRNGLLKANDSRSYLNQPFARRSAGLPTGVSSANNRQSPFEKDAPSGPRTPQTAPLPPDNANDLSMQRASTGNMFLISPGPLSAPSGSSLFSPGFRQSWAASQTQFDLSPKSSPGATPYVDPKGHLVPALSITSNDGAAVRPIVAPVEHEAPTEQDSALNALSVPNFSRQLPLRRHESMPPERSLIPPNSTELYVSSQPLELRALRSPAVPRFNISPLVSDQAAGCPLVSPVKAEFNINPWLQSHEVDSQFSTKSNVPPLLPPLISPTSTGFPVASLRCGDHGTLSGAFSSRGTTFETDVGSTDFDAKRGSASPQDFVVASPVRTEFPKDMFDRIDDTCEDDLTSPRATEFHMTPLKPKVADEDPFGLTSPTRFEFSSSTPPPLTQPEPRRPSVQAIRPPIHLPQPEMVNGFASLNTTAQAPPISFKSLDRPKAADPEGRVDSISTSLAPPMAIPVKEYMANAEISQKGSPVTTATHSRLMLPTPPLHGAVRTRFSSPNMREQRRLHKLQTEMEAMLPKKAQHIPQAADDLDALLSPRAEEFTRNPFHFELPVSTYDTSPASSIETVKDVQNGVERTEQRQWTPKKVLEEDPRSPVQTGSSPITRNIWDIL